MKKTTKKIIIICLLCVLLISTFVFSASAVHGIYRTLPIARPPCDSSYGYVEVVVDHNNGSYGCFVYIFQLLNTDEDSHVIVTCSNNSRTMNFSYSGVSGGAVNVICMNEAGTKWELGGGSLISDTHTKGDIVGIHCYGPALTINLTSYNYPFSLLYSEDSAAYVMLNSILQELRGNNSEIIQNQNENAQQIIDAQKEATEQVTNGYEASAQPNTDSIGSLQSVEGNIDSATASGRDNVNSTFSNFSLGNNSSIGKGMLAFTNIAKEFLGISGFNEIINFGLVLGLVAFLLGVGAIFTGGKNKKGKGDDS